MIDRKLLVSKHNPILTEIDTTSPFTVGNGEFAFTLDITGTQSLYSYYEKGNMPLCTMHQQEWGISNGDYTLDDVEHTQYKHAGKTVKLPVKKYSGSEKAYDWLRQNPHRANLFRVSFLYNGNSINHYDLTNIKQELDLYTGVITSNFCILEKPIKITTVCHGEQAIVAIKIEADADITFCIDIPTSSHGMSGSDWSNILKNVQIKNKVLVISYEKSSLEFDKISFYDCLKSSQNMWQDFWGKVGIASFKGSIDKRATELERRIILSLYLTRIQSCGSLPPQETGLTCNSWHGKFHLEMHLWHSGFFPLFNIGEQLEKSLFWYKKILPKAKHNAEKNGYKGVRWPKQVAYDGIDSPSPISPLLVWQQPHILYMLEFLYHTKKSENFLEEYWELVKETTDFMCDFLVKDKYGKYNLEPPLIPAQEEFDPLTVKNPTFEIEYFRFGILISINWAKRLGRRDIEFWEEVSKNIAFSPQENGIYLSHENSPFTNRDHPSMLGAFGLINNDRIDKEKMKDTLQKVISCWQWETCWGWDFAMMSMTATRLDMPELAIELLLMDTPKNFYVTSGNNFQKTRTDLPLYLPGNGSLLLAVSLMLAGYGDKTNLPGIPKNGKWEVRFENISKFFD